MTTFVSFQPLWPVLTTPTGQLIVDNTVPVTLRPSSVSGVTMPQQQTGIGSPQHPRMATGTEPSTTTTAPDASHLVQSPGQNGNQENANDSSCTNVVLRPRRPGPPPPERRDSMLPRPASTPSQHSSEGDINRSSKGSQFDQSPVVQPTMLDSGAEDDGSGSPQSAHTAQRVPHPLAMGLITGPNGVNSASCLSLAARGRSALSRRSLFAADSQDASDADDSDRDRLRGSQSDFEKVGPGRLRKRSRRS
ncbi:unnamed protein product [Echinostoma caproni]|uniref:Uncharacterized protein n=1 Tax=Echinostoma caproni TaxID=27848 RepID=A0A183BE25_9TREM|nr:unnamed protein product [Echinostoma caproni]